MISKGIVHAVIALFVISLVSGAFSRSKRLKKNPDGVYLPDLLPIIAIFGFIVVGTLMIVSAIYEILYAVIGYAVGVLMCIAMLIGWKNCYILYDEDGFIHHTFWGRTRRYTYDQITSYKGGRDSSKILYAGKKKIRVDQMAMNADAFMETVMEKHDGNLPARKRAYDPFNGNMKNGEGALYVYFGLLIVIVAGAIWWTIAVSAPINASNCEKQKIVFETWKIKKEDLYLYPEDGSRYILEDYAPYVEDVDEIKELCENNKKFTVYSKHYSPDSKDEHHLICELSYKDEVFFSFDDANARNKKEAVWLIGCAWGGVALSILYMIGSIIAGRNPEKHPILAKILFRGDVFRTEEEKQGY